MNSRPERRRGVLSRTPALVAGVLLLAASACGGGRGPGGVTGGAATLDSVVLVTIDTLRADHVSCYGPSPVTTPTLDALARRGALAERAWTPIPLTTPAHASILSGLYPPGHGVRNNARFRLPDDVTTLAETLAGNGRTTAAFVSSFTTSAMFGLAQGFGTFDDDMGNESDGARRTQRPGDETVGHAIAWLDRVGDRPFFLWVHLFDPHTPYTPPRDFGERFPRDPYSGEVAFADAQVGRLFDALDKAGLSRRAVVIAVADHGEGLGTHGEDEHGLLLYEETVHVPLIVAAPGKVAAGSRIEGVTSTVDIAPTVLALLGVPAPKGLHGRDMFAAPAAGAPPREVYAETLYPFEEFGWSALYALRRGDAKYIESPQPELFDVKADPKEGENVIARKAADAAALRTALAATTRAIVDEGRLSAAAGFGGDADPETIARLESLGYAAGGGGAARGAAAEALPAVGGRAPREAMDDYGRFKRAQQLASGGQVADAVRILEKLRAGDPGNPQVAFKLATTLDKAGRDAEAERAYRALIAQHPTFYLGYRYFSTFLEGRKRPREAHDLWVKLGGLLPGYVGIETKLAETETLSGAPAEAIKRLGPYLDKHPQDVDGWTQLGKAREAAGEAAGAIEAYRRALALRPTERDAVNAAVALLKREGKADDARALVQALLVKAPGDPVLIAAAKGL